MLHYMEETANIPAHDVMKVLKNPRCLNEIAEVIKNGGPLLDRIFGSVKIVGVSEDRKLRGKSAYNDMLERAKEETDGWANDKALAFYADPKHQHLLPQKDENGRILEEIMFPDTEKPGQNDTKMMGGLWRGKRMGHKHQGDRTWHPFCTDPRHLVFYRAAIPGILIQEHRRESVLKELLSQS